MTRASFWYRISICYRIFIFVPSKSGMTLFSAHPGTLPATTAQKQDIGSSFTFLYTEGVSQFCFLIMQVLLWIIFECGCCWKKSLLQSLWMKNGNNDAHSCSDSWWTGSYGLNQVFIETVFLTLLVGCDVQLWLLVP